MQGKQGFALLSVVIFLAIIGFAMLLLGDQSGDLHSGIALATEENRLTYVMQAATTHAYAELRNKGCSAYSAIARPFGAGNYSVNYSTPTGSPLDLTITGSLATGRTDTLVKSAVSSYGSSTVTNITVTNATYIDEAKPDQKKGDADKLDLTEAATHDHRILLAQALDEIPPQARIDAAELILTMKKIQPNFAVKVERVTEDWVEDEATWDNRQDGRRHGSQYTGPARAFCF